LGKENFSETTESAIEKQLYAYQQNAIDEIFKRLNQHSSNYNLLYQLPTGGRENRYFFGNSKKIYSVDRKKSNDPHASGGIVRTDCADAA